MPNLGRVTSLRSGAAHGVPPNRWLPLLLMQQLGNQMHTAFGRRYGMDSLFHTGDDHPDNGSLVRTRPAREGETLTMPRDRSPTTRTPFSTSAERLRIWRGIVARDGLRLRT